MTEESPKFVRQTMNTVTMSPIYRFLFFRTKDRAEYLRTIMFLFATMLEFLITPFHFLGVIGIQEWPMYACSAALLVTDVVTLLLWCFRLISIAPAVRIAAILSQLIFSTRIILLLSGNYHSALQMIAVNEMFSYLLVILLVVAVMTPTAFVVAAINIASLFVAYAVYHDYHIVEMLVLFGMMQFTTAGFGVVLRNVLKDTRVELNDYRQLARQMQRFFHMSFSDINAMFAIADNRKYNGFNSKDAISHLSLHAQNDIVAVADMIKEQHIRQRDDMREKFPMLSDTELCVCRLIAAGKTIKQIAVEMDKTVSNIGTVRVNIRRKLNLPPAQDLKSYLANSIKG